MEEVTHILGRLEAEHVGGAEVRVDGAVHECGDELPVARVRPGDVGEMLDGGAGQPLPHIAGGEVEVIVVQHDVGAIILVLARFGNASRGDSGLSNVIKRRTLALPLPPDFRILGESWLTARLVMPDEQTKQAYREAYGTWQRHLAEVHVVLLKGQHLDPPRLKGLLNREARAKARYDAARRDLLGIEGSSDGTAEEGM